jgi:hypothetical protein
MKKVFFISLLLVSIFLISNAAIAVLPADGGCHYYLCNGTHLCSDGLSIKWTEECVEICTDEGRAGAEGEWWECNLGGRSLFASNKNFTGFGVSSEGTLGCSITLRGRSMTVDLYEFDANPTCMDQLRCVESAECVTD